MGGNSPGPTLNHEGPQFNCQPDCWSILGRDPIAIQVGCYLETVVAIVPSIDLRYCGVVSRCVNIKHPRTGISTLVDCQGWGGQCRDALIETSKIVPRCRSNKETTLIPRLGSLGEPLL